MSIFGPFPPTIIPHDAQTVPPPPYIPEPPNCMLYGWLLEPELFGPGTIVLRSNDGSMTTFKRPTTAMQAYDTFQFVAIALRLMRGMRIEWPTDKRPRIASFAEALKDGVRSGLNDGDKMPPAALIQKTVLSVDQEDSGLPLSLSPKVAPLSQLFVLVSPSNSRYASGALRLHRTKARLHQPHRIPFQLLRHSQSIYSSASQLRSLPSPNQLKVAPAPPHPIPAPPSLSIQLLRISASTPPTTPFGPLPTRSSPHDLHIHRDHQKPLIFHLNIVKKHSSIREHVSSIDETTAN
ncbi:hypothetical protein B0H11DRAFT_2182520, partial [Mycena galericulata]